MPISSAEADSILQGRIDFITGHLKHARESLEAGNRPRCVQHLYLILDADHGDNTVHLFRIRQLEHAIRRHRDQKGHDRCHLDDDALYAHLPEGGAGADRTLPPREEFLEGCARFYELRKTGVSFEHCSLNAILAERDKLQAKLVRAHKVIDELNDKLTPSGDPGF